MPALTLDRVALSRTADVLAALKKPSLLVKYPCQEGHKPHGRRFLLTADGRTLQWGSVKREAYNRVLQLGQVRYIVVGPFTKAFQKYQKSERLVGHDRCFSLVRAYQKFRRRFVLTLVCVS